MSRLARAGLPLLAGLTVWSACASGRVEPGTQPASYDPPGSLRTMDKPIAPVHRRTIGFLEHGLWISNELPGGRLNDAWLEGDSVLVGRILPENAPINNSAWYAFKVWSEEPREITLRLDYEDGRPRYWPKVRRAAGAWEPLPDSAVVMDRETNTATLRLPVGPDTVWVAGQEMFTSAAFYRWTDSLSALPHVARERIGSSRLGRPIEMLTITENPASTDHVLLISRQHPPEVTGTMALLRFVEEIAGDSPLAREFRQAFRVSVVPIVNPDGVDLGHWRHNTGGVDLNRDWVHFNQQETRAVRDALLAVAGQPGHDVWFSADFHSTGRDVFYTLAEELETDPPGFLDRWLVAIADSVPGYVINESPSGLGGPTSRNWFYRTFGPHPSLTYEVGDRQDRVLIDDVATAAARAMMRLLLEEGGR